MTISYLWQEPNWYDKKKQTTSILKGGKHMAYRRKFVNEKKIMYGLRIPNLYVKNMHHME